MQNEKVTTLLERGYLIEFSIFFDSEGRSEVHGTFVLDDSPRYHRFGFKIASRVTELLRESIEDVIKEIEEDGEVSSATRYVI